MTTYLLRRLILMIPTLIGITFLVFMIVALAPGGIGATLMAQAGQMQSQSNVAVQKAYLEDRYGLDASAPVQYVRWLGRISPIKFGARDLASPSGELIRAPKELQEPPVWRWFAQELPTEPAPTISITRDDPEDKRVEVYKAAARKYSDARGEYLTALTKLKESLATYAAELKIKGAVDDKGLGRADVIGKDPPNTAAVIWPTIQQRAEAMMAAYKLAQAARADLKVSFDSKPYPQAGFSIIPGVVSVATPDLGVAYSQGRPVIDLISKALPVTLLINLIAFPIIYAIAIPGGMLAATKRGSALDVGLGTGFIALWSFPVVLAGILAIGFLASKEYLGWFPVSGLHSNNATDMRFLPSTGPDGKRQMGYLLDMLWHVCLPVMCLVYPGFAILSKQTRAAMLENFSADYVRTAKAKGVAPKDVVLRHVFRNSLLPLITMFVTIFPAMLSGSVVVEKIFNVPGMGSLILQSIQDRDRELLLANTMMIAGVNLLALLLADVLYALADPRVAYE